MERKENQITLRGTAAETPTLSHQSRGLDFYRFPLSVPRLSGKEDRLNIFVPSGLPLPREGDYVEISGFRGRVMEIGVRSTKLLNDNNDVKTINNHDISNVVNLSKHTSYCWVKFRVRTKNSLKDIEAMLERELPAFKDQIPNLVSGPTYAGVIDIDDGITTLGIVAEAREEDVLSVQNELNKAVRTLYERKMLYPTKEVSNRITLRFDEGNPGVVRMRREQEEENKEENRELNKEQKNSAEGEKKGHGTDV